ncbi:ER membrane protein complex subunit 1 [Hypsibius exemplaris]|uniref:ER membrane protein complex subunit 1 n=1 Tax=Hypsibius exemplaris TaxID=2072580 RepID=A0A1W0XAZ1_HYPEX|nr:ER membrane protein complex subunit 1 [Hypsibius exemplaris]
MSPFLRYLYGLLCTVLFLLSISQVIEAIHEDQVGLNDWSLQFIGRPLEVLVSATQTGSSKSLAFIYSEQNVLAAIDTKHGEIVWRHVLENGENGTINSGVVLEDEVCVLLNRGRLLRCFDTLTGSFKWEKLFGGQDTHLGKCIAVSDSKERKAPNRIICANDDRIISFASRSGNVQWESKCAKAQKRLLFQSLSGELIVGGLVENKISVKRLSVSTGEAKNAGVDRSAIVHPSTTDCRLVQPASQVPPYLICFDSSTSRLFSHSTSEVADKAQKDLRLEDLGGIAHTTGDGVFLNSFPTDGLFSVSTNGESLLLHLSADGQIKLIKKVTGFYAGCSETDVVIVELADQIASVRVAKYDGNSLTPQAEEALTFPFSTSHGSLESVTLLPSKDVANCIRPAFLFLTEGDVLGLFSQGKLAWKREEGLARLSVTAIVDLPISDIEALVEEEFEEKGSFPVRFTKRLVSQGLQLKKILELAGKRVMSGLRIGKYFHKEQLERDYFNTQKIIVSATESGKIFGLDSRNGDVVYSSLLKNFAKPKDRSIQFYIQRTGAHAPFPSQSVLVGADKRTGNGLLYFFDCITGEQLDQPVTLNRPILQSGLIPVMSSNHLEAIFVLDSDLNLSIYPENLDMPEITAFVKDSLHIFDVCSKTGVARGYRVKLVNKAWKAVEVWSATLTTAGEAVLTVSPKRPHDFVHSQGRVLADRRVLYKYINPNLVAVTVQGTDEGKKPYLKIVGLDGITGRVVFSQVHRRARGPCHVVHSEHWVMYTYWNEKVRSNEIGVIEMYRGFEKPNQTYFSSLESFEKPELSSVAFKLPGFISAISDTVTVEGITHKNLIVALASGSVTQIPKVLLDPRRPMFPTQAEREEGLIPYAPELPLVTENIINYYKKVYRIRGIKTAGAGLESISLVFTYGIDLFFTRVTPSALFDVLSDSFDYWILTVVMLVMTIASVIVRHMANTKALEQAWK